jgi:hypothetical protein
MSGDGRGLALHWRILAGLVPGSTLGVAGNLVLGPEHAALRWARAARQVQARRGPGR